LFYFARKMRRSLSHREISRTNSVVSSVMRPAVTSGSATGSATGTSAAGTPIAIVGAGASRRYRLTRAAWVPPPRVCVVGALGAGKSTHAKRLAAAHKLAHVSLAQLLMPPQPPTQSQSQSQSAATTAATTAGAAAAASKAASAPSSSSASSSSSSTAPASNLLPLDPAADCQAAIEATLIAFASSAAARAGFLLEIDCYRAGVAAALSSPAVAPLLALTAVLNVIVDDEDESHRRADAKRLPPSAAAPKRPVAPRLPLTADAEAREAAAV
jgi:hypothetical protein